MSFNDILAPILSVDEDEPALAAAEIIAERAKGSVRALLVEVEPQPVLAADGGVSGFAWAEMLDAARAQFRGDKSKLDLRVKRSTTPMTSSEMTTLLSVVGADVAVEARCADLSVILRPDGGMDGVRTSMFEGALFGSGRPVMVIPPRWTRQRIGANILIAWNGKREAARALADAAPFLQGGAKITIASVDVGKVSRDLAAATGEQVVAHLRRRGLGAELRELDNLDGSEALALFAEARALEADLIVMGGYGRSRMREFVFGGVTREALKSAPLPLFMSH